MTFQLNKNHLPLLLALLSATVVILFKLVTEDVYKDEAVEYYLSSSFSGLMPGCSETTMYQRVLWTFQPPLYNVIMRLWLLVSTNFIWFRLLGLILILGSAVGIYNATKTFTGNYLWAAASAMFFIFIPEIMHYAVESAEYSLMLFFNSWAVYYFARCLKSPSSRLIISFVVCCTLALYSQYGSAISSVAMGIALLGFYLYQHKKEAARTLIVVSLISIIAAAIPLFIWFAKEQFAVQHTSTTSYTPYFYKGSFILDFLYAPRHFCQYLFGDAPCLHIMGGFVLISLISLLLKRNSRNTALLVAFSIAWISVYWLMVCSVYGRNFWEPYNHGILYIMSRYILFIVPMAITLFSTGLNRGFQFIENPKTKKIATAFLCVLLLTSCSIHSFAFHNRHETNKHMNEVTDLWIQHADKSINTYVFADDIFDFNLFLTRHKDYTSELHESIKYFHLACATPDPWYKKHNPLIYLKEPKFYVVINSYWGYADAFLTTIPADRYQVKTLFNNYYALFLIEERKP